MDVLVSRKGTKNMRTKHTADLVPWPQMSTKPGSVNLATDPAYHFYTDKDGPALLVNATDSEGRGVSVMFDLEETARLLKAIENRVFIPAK